VSIEFVVSIVIGKLPVTLGMPESTPLTNSTPLGNVPCQGSSELAGRLRANVAEIEELSGASLIDKGQDRRDLGPYLSFRSGLRV
jgi:hypothetical protein